MRSSLAGALVVGCALLGSPRLAGCDDLVFASGGLGVGSLGIGAAASLNTVRGGTLYGFRVATVEEFNIFGPSPSESSTDFGLLIGKASSSRHGLSYASAGLGLVQSVRRGRMTQSGWFFLGSQHERIERTRLGIPVDLGTVFHAGHVGIGLNLFGNLNTDRSFAGLALSLQLGKMR